MTKPHTYQKPWLLTDRRMTVVISRYATEEAASDAATMYGRGFRAVHIDDLETERRKELRISEGKWT